ncbi:MAG: magnesium/cobalt transporter CorA [Acidobacteria bacterium]|nr:magnesium/cobalt transporter CorA [Acidobacteriota bacterium]MBI3663639.1 magnesium/cobalt transporter CorA [Acidobacteriota bacterium]
MNELGPAATACLVGERNGFRWFHIEDVKGRALDDLAAAYGLHELAVEDCRTPGTRAKLEEYEHHVFLVVNTLHFDSEKCHSWYGEFDIFMGKDFVITVHDGPSRTAAAVRPRFETEVKLAHQARLLHALLRVIVGRYLPVLDTVEERIDQLEDKAYERPSPQLLSEIFATKRALIDFRRVCSTMREAINLLLTRNEPWLRTHQAYFRDIYDQVVRTLDFVDTYRDILTGVLDVYLTATANRTNEIVKVLTIYATLAMPVVLITGYFGMNFRGLPLVENPMGLTIIHSFLVVSTLAVLWFFKRRGWF